MAINPYDNIIRQRMAMQAGGFSPYAGAYPMMGFQQVAPPNPGNTKEYYVGPAQQAQADKMLRFPTPQQPGLGGAGGAMYATGNPMGLMGLSGTIAVPPKSSQFPPETQKAYDQYRATRGMTQEMRLQDDPEYWASMAKKEQPNWTKSPSPVPSMVGSGGYGRNQMNSGPATAATAATAAPAQAGANTSGGLMSLFGAGLGNRQPEPLQQAQSQLQFNRNPFGGTQGVGVPGSGTYQEYPSSMGEPAGNRMYTGGTPGFYDNQVNNSFGYGPPRGFDPYAQRGGFGFDPRMGGGFGGYGGYGPPMGGFGGYGGYGPPMGGGFGGYGGGYGPPMGGFGGYGPPMGGFGGYGPPMGGGFGGYGGGYGQQMGGGSGGYGQQMGGGFGNFGPQQQMGGNQGPQRMGGGLV